MLIKKFEEQVSRTPHKVAVDTGDKAFTYDCLNRHANRVARLIEECLSIGGNPGTIALLFDHGAEMISAILGVLKSGNAYVPLSPDYPDNRVSYILKDSRSCLLLTGSRYPERASGLARALNINSLNVDIATGAENVSQENRSRQPDPLGNAYIMYTSGSTGQ
ncbi:MAG: AMP-binding protein, partial [bacterium]|nr:AMP-binding protein [bacterium]